MSKTQKKRLAVVLCAAAAAVWLFIFAVNYAIIRQTTPVTNPKRYQSIISELKSGVSASTHFPDRIPVSASPVTFFYQPHFLQGPLILRLRMTLLASEIAELDRHLRAKYTPLDDKEVDSIFGGVGGIGIPRVGVPYRSEEPRDSYFEKMPDDFSSFRINLDLENLKNEGGDPAICPEGGVSISRARNEVLYWIN